jgi:dipeptidyl aminopeptidase/acylaminoacyl peptidase
MCVAKRKVALTVTLAIAVAGGGVRFVFESAPADGQGDRQQAPGQPAVVFQRRDAALPAGAFLRLTAGYTAVLAPDGKSVASATIGDGIVHVWEVPTGKELSRYEGQEALVNCLAFSPDGKTLAMPGKSGDIVLSEVATGNQLRRIAGHDRPLGSLVFSPDGQVLAAGGWEGTIRLWDAATGREFRQLGKTAAYLAALAFSPDSKAVATAGRTNGEPGNEYKGVVSIWDVATGKERRQLQCPRCTFVAVTWSPDGKLVAAGSHNEKRIRLWAVGTGNELPALAIPDSNVTSLAFSPDNRILAVAGGHHHDSIYVLEVATHRERCRFRTATPGRKRLAFTPDSRILVSGGPDTFFWDVTGRLQSGVLRPVHVPLQQLPVLWTDLGSEDAPKAQSAVWTLVAASEQSVAFLKQHLRPAQWPDKERLARLVRDLDDDRFAVREQATKELAELADMAEPALRQGLEGTPSLEVRRRIEQLLTSLAEWSPEQLRSLRGVEVLEQSGTADAKRLLQELAKGTSGSRLTQEAEAALQRLAKRLARP